MGVYDREDEEWYEGVSPIGQGDDGDNEKTTSASIISANEGKNNTVTPADLKASEEEAAPDAASTAQDPQESDIVGKGFRNELGKSLLFGAKFSTKKNNLKKLALIGAPGLFLFMGVILVFMIMSSLKIQNVAAHVLEYNMLRAARTFNQSSNELVAERYAIDAGNEGLLSRVKNPAAEWWGKFDRFRPEKMLKNLRADGQLQFVSEEVNRTILPGKKLELKKILVAGEEIPITNKKFGRFFSNINAEVQFKAELDTALQKAMPESPNLVRSRVAKKIQAELGYKSLSWWKKKAFDYKGKKADVAFAQEQKNSFEIIKSEADNSIIPEISDQADAADKELREAVAKGTAPETQLDKVLRQEVEGVGGKAASGTAQQEAENAVADALASAAKSQKNIGADALKSLSTIYQIAFPVCLVYDGSVVHQTPEDINKKRDAARKTYYMLQTAADQQKAGDTTPEAVGALNNKMRQIGDSIPERRARGETVNTDDYLSGPDLPEAGGVGTYSPINLFFGDSWISDNINGLLDDVCPVILHPATLVAGVLIEVGAAIFSGGSSAAAEQGAKEAATIATEQIVKEEVKDQVEKAIGKELAEQATKEVVKDSVKKTFAKKAGGFVKKLGIDVVKYGTITIIAKMLVLQHMQGSYTGLSTSKDFINEADAGGMAEAQTIQQQVLYGAPMTKEAVTASAEADLAYHQNKQASKSTYERYFALSNPFSAASLSGMQGLHAAEALSANTPGFVRNKLQISKFFSVQNILSPLFLGATKKATAITKNQQIGNHGVMQIGWTEEEFAAIRSNENYGLVLNNDYVASNSTLFTEIENEYGVCFTSSHGELVSEKDHEALVKRDKEGNVIADNGKCSPQNLGMKNPKYGDNVFRWRKYMRDQFMLEHGLDVQEPKAEGNQNSQDQPVNPNIYLLGDSLMVGMRDSGDLQAKLSAAGWTNATVQAYCGRHLSGTGDRCGAEPPAPYDGLNQIKQGVDQAAITSAGSIVIELGTNDWQSTTFAADVSSIIDSIRAVNQTAQIYWVNLFSNDQRKANLATMNLTLSDLAQPSKKNFKIIDWASIASTYYADSSDGLHPSKHYPEMSDKVVSGVGSPSSVGGLTCPNGTLETVNGNGTTYYKMPEAPNGEYTIYSSSAQRYGSKELVCALYTVSMKYNQIMGGKSKLSIGDLNASGHKSHKWGVAVDLDAQGQVWAADHINDGGKYSTDATITLGKLFVDTGIVRNIWWCEPNDGSLNAILTYAKSKNAVEGEMKCIEGHQNHFHVDILQKFRGEEYEP